MVDRGVDVVLVHMYVLSFGKITPNGHGLSASLLVYFVILVSLVADQRDPKHVK